MSEYSASDLRQIEKSLDKIADKLSGGLFSADPGRNLARMTDQLDKVISRLDDISRKLSNR